MADEFEKALSDLVEFARARLSAEECGALEDAVSSWGRRWKDAVERLCEVVGRRLASCLGYFVSQRRSAEHRDPEGDERALVEFMSVLRLDPEDDDVRGLIESMCLPLLMADPLGGHPQARAVLAEFITKEAERGRNRLCIPGVLSRQTIGRAAHAAVGDLRAFENGQKAG